MFQKPSPKSRLSSVTPSQTKQGDKKEYGLTLLFTFSNSQDDIYSMYWSPSGNMLACVPRNYTIQLRNSQTGQLLCELTGHTTVITDIAWSPNGNMLASCSRDHTVQVWNSQTGQLLYKFDHEGDIWRVEWSPDGNMLASCSDDRTVRLWDPRSGKQRAILKGHTETVGCVEWSPDGNMLASCSSDHTVRLWDPRSGKQRAILEGHDSNVWKLAWSPDGNMLASCSDDRTVRLWDPRSGKQRAILEGHNQSVYQVKWSPDGNMLASCSDDRTVRLWDPRSGKQRAILEGHTDRIESISFSADGQLLATSSIESIRLWYTDTLENLINITDVSQGESDSPFVTFHPSKSMMITSGNTMKDVAAWSLDLSKLLESSVTDEIRYTNAKVVLMGDSGVGKSGLGLVLSGEPFKPTESTHGRRIWVLEKTDVVDSVVHNETHEILLWDLAGQPGYRLIHQLHLGEVVVALVIFDAKSETNPFVGVQYWERALRQAQYLQGANTLPLKKFLVSARADRGGINVSPERIQGIMQELGFDGYFETSAKLGLQIDPLKKAIKDAIDWKSLPIVSSTQLFGDIKDFLVRVKESGRSLSRVDTLYEIYLKSKDSLSETPGLFAQFETCIGRLESVGLIQRLSFGSLVLLQPELLDHYGSALINAVKKEPDGLGSISEDRVLTGDFFIPEENRIANQADEKLLLIAMVEDLLRRELVLREESFLVFPSQSTRENPNLPEPEGKETVFTFEGPVLNIYATLAVRLANSGLFMMKELWSNAITYTTKVGGTFGMFLQNRGEGYAELTLFFDKVTSEEMRFHFEGYIQTHLQRRALPQSIQRYRLFACSECGEAFAKSLVERRQSRGFTWLNCPVCGMYVSLLDRKERLADVLLSGVVGMDRSADGQRDRDTDKSILQGKIETNDFDVFLCHNHTDKAAVKQIGKRLKELGILPWLDEWELRPGLPWQHSLEQQIKRIKSAAVFVGRNGRGPWQDMELGAFIREFVRRGCPVIPIILADADSIPELPVFLAGMTWVDFRKDEPDPIEQLLWGITGKRVTGLKMMDKSNSS